MNYKMTVQYDGGRYAGWQRQGNTEKTIQAVLEQRLTQLLSEAVEVHGSGRTDAGVHALGQVASFKTTRRLDCAQVLPELNAALPGDIAVTHLEIASERFHARLNAKEKTYRYTVWNSPIPDVMGRRYQYQVAGVLDLPTMERGAALLLGTHDFRGFSTGHTKKSTVRFLRQADIRREGDRVELWFTGNGFLYNMVRIMAGTLLEIGLGTRDPESISTVFQTCDRQRSGFTAPAQGLCLMQVRY